MPEPTEAKHARKRRWMRVSLRTFLVFVTLVGVGLGAWIIPSLSQRQSVRGIENMGGEVVYNNDLVDPVTGDPISQLRPPKWLVETLGIDFFYSVTDVRVSGFRWRKNPPPFELDGFVSHLERLPKCRSLNLSMVGLLDDDIAKLAPLAGQLESLSIREVWPGNARGPGLVHIKDWPHLKSLAFRCRYFESLDLTSLSTCPKLEELSLGNGRLEEKDFAEIAKCQQIATLGLGNCSFKGPHLELLRKLKSLKRLYLTNCAPRVVIESWTITPDGKRITNVADGFDFEAADPQFITPFEEGFPTDRYNDWKKRTLPNVSVFELFLS